MLLGSVKIDQMQIIPHSLEAFRESQFWYEAKFGPLILLSADSWTELSEAFVIFIVILLTQFPTQHRYTDIVPDLQITKIPYKAIPAREFTGGRLSNDLSFETCLTYFHFQNKLNLSMSGKTYNIEP